MTPRPWPRQGRNPSTESGRGWGEQRAHAQVTSSPGPRLPGRHTRHQEQPGSLPRLPQLQAAANSKTDAYSIGPSWGVRGAETRAPHAVSHTEMFAFVIIIRKWKSGFFFRGTLPSFKCGQLTGDFFFPKYCVSQTKQISRLDLAHGSSPVTSARRAPRFPPRQAGRWASKTTSQALGSPHFHHQLPAREPLNGK